MGHISVMEHLRRSVCIRRVFTAPLIRRTVAAERADSASAVHVTSRLSLLVAHLSGSDEGF